jgi:hypothetical protein
LANSWGREILGEGRGGCGPPKRQRSCLAGKSNPDNKGQIKRLFNASSLKPCRKIVERNLPVPVALLSICVES